MNTRMQETALQAGSSDMAAARAHSFTITHSCCTQQDAALLDALRADLAAAGLSAKVIYSGGVDVDILAAVSVQSFVQSRLCCVLALWHAAA